MLTIKGRLKKSVVFCLGLIVLTASSNALAETIEECYEKGKEYYDQGNFKEAHTWIFKAAEQGHITAQYKLGVMYKTGEGVRKDYAEAVKWYRKAAEQGYARGQNNLGYMYAKGKGVRKDYAEAVKWYRKAAEQGQAKAQYNLGLKYDNGKGVKKDHAEAVKWYRKAAEQGQAKAQSRLGYMYTNGEGVEKDYAEAVKWWRKAAEQGDANAKYTLRFHYDNSEGVEQVTGRPSSKKTIAPGCLVIGMSYDEVKAKMQVGKESHVVGGRPGSATEYAYITFDLVYQCSFPIQFGKIKCLFESYKGVERLKGVCLWTDYSSKREALDNYNRLFQYVDQTTPVPYNGPCCPDCIASARWWWWSPSAPSTEILLYYQHDKYCLDFLYVDGRIPTGVHYETVFFP